MRKILVKIELDKVISRANRIYADEKAKQFPSLYNQPKGRASLSPPTIKSDQVKAIARAIVEAINGELP